MRSTAAKNLYVGAVVLNGAHLDTVASLRRQGSSYNPAVRVSFEPTEAHRSGRHTVVEPDHDFPLARIHSVAWVIHSRHRNARAAQDRARISVPYCVRDHWAFRQPGIVVDRLSEEHTVITCRPIGLDELPAQGDPTPPPPNPDSSRFYRLYRQGPAVLPTGDGVRAELARLAELHRREHGRTDWDMGQRLPAEGDMYDCSRCTRSPYDLMPMEVAVERTYRDVTLDDLPTDWEYELWSARAYERHLLMGTVTPPPPPRRVSGIGDGDIVEFAVGGSQITGRAKVIDAAPGNDPVTGMPLVVLAGLGGRPFRRALSGCVRIAPPVNLTALTKDVR
ncbi:hypothetical protein OG883_44150 [Streptomyces sp. NBC_01142]|uniref:hypothetical protein n=1 Tax=Streptomyces sp. NBC_01142 TaxID=2975865 RepID=UPI00224F2B3C|nr:hypothetical protein [Streptomyces sp. NBC_01142]MCX4826636.1 hypothetical protein [Streptomyces sp. NBC_01142]